MQKKFNVYVGFSSEVEQEVDTLMGHLHKSLRICRGGEDNQSLRSESLRICRGRRNDQSRDISWAIDSSDILVPVFHKHKQHHESNYDTMRNSNGLVIPFFPHEVRVLWGFCHSCVSPYLHYKDL